MHAERGNTVVRQEHRKDRPNQLERGVPRAGSLDGFAARLSGVGLGLVWVASLGVFALNLYLFVILRVLPPGIVSGLLLWTAILFPAIVTGRWIKYRSWRRYGPSRPSSKVSTTVRTEPVGHQSAVRPDVVDRAAAPHSDVRPGSQTRECPWCAETIMARAVYCKHCHRDVPEISSVASGLPSDPASPATEGYAAHEPRIESTPAKPQGYHAQSAPSSSGGNRARAKLRWFFGAVGPLAIAAVVAVALARQDRPADTVDASGTHSDSTSDRASAFDDYQSLDTSVAATTDIEGGASSPRTTSASVTSAPARTAAARTFEQFVGTISDWNRRVAREEGIDFGQAPDGWLEPRYFATASQRPDVSRYFQGLARAVTRMQAEYPEFAETMIRAHAARQRLTPAEASQFRADFFRGFEVQRASNEAITRDYLELSRVSLELHRFLNSIEGRVSYDEAADMARFDRDAERLRAAALATEIEAIIERITRTRTGRISGARALVEPSTPY